jgi:hypothetical protein
MKLCLFTVPLGLALLLGCGGGGTATPPSGSAGPPQPLSGSTTVLVNFGDFANMPRDSGPTVDQIVSFELTLDSVALRSSKGDVPLLSNPRRFELSRLSGKFEPLLLGNVAQGNYSAVVIGISNPEISFIDSSGVLHEDIAASLTSSTATINVPVSISSTSMVINLIPLADSVSFGGSNVVSVTPQFGASTVSLPAEAARGGQVEDLVGRVTVVVEGANSSGRPNFTIDTNNGSTFTFAWDWWDFFTEFQGFSDWGKINAGMTVEVNAYPSGDVSNPFFASKVKLEHDVASEIVVEGPAVSLAPAQLEIVVREVHGPDDLTLPGVGKVLTVDANASTQFRLEPDDIDLNNLDFTPTFDALTVAPGQNVRVAAAGGSATTITADQLKLKKQSLDGIAGAVTAGSVSGQFSFPLNLTADSAFAHLSGHTSVLVTVQPSTEVFIFNLGDGCITCITDQPVRVRGLLFFSGGQYRLVAERLAEN